MKVDRGEKPLNEDKKNTENNGFESLELREVQVIRTN